MTALEIVLVAAPDRAFRHSLEFALESAGYRTNAYLSATGAFDSGSARDALCAVIDDLAVEDWKVAPEQLLRFGKPVVLLVNLFRNPPPLPRVTLVMKPFLGEPLIEAVRNAIGGAA